MKLNAFAVEWMRRAEQDYKTVLYILKDAALSEQVCFHSQQMAEKYLKTFLILHSKKFTKTHNLIHLIELCEEVDATFQELMEGANLLNGLYLESRYPSEVFEFSMTEAKKAFLIGKQIRKFVVAKLK